MCKTFGRQREVPRFKSVTQDLSNQNFLVRFSKLSVPKFYPGVSESNSGEAQEFIILLNYQWFGWLARFESFCLDRRKNPSLSFSVPTMAHEIGTSTMNFTLHVREGVSASPWFLFPSHAPWPEEWPALTSKAREDHLACVACPLSPGCCSLLRRPEQEHLL